MLPPLSSKLKLRNENSIENFVCFYKWIEEVDCSLFYFFCTTFFNILFFPTPTHKISQLNVIFAKSYASDGDEEFI